MTSFLEGNEQKYVLDENNPRMEAALNYIIGFDIKITSWEGKYKISQDKNKEDQRRAKETLIESQSKIINHIDKIVNDAEVTGSVNTIFLDKNKKIIGENTDVFGLQAAYLKEIDNNLNKKALVIGAGGVSPSVILSLQKSGIRSISITNRTSEKCIFLKRKFNFLNILSWENLKSEIKNFDIIINATSLGLKNGEDFNFNFSSTRDEVIYIDTIYNPLETKTFKHLKKEGKKVFNGLDMFIYQGQKSFYLWNKINPEIDDGLIELLNSKLI